MSLNDTLNQSQEISTIFEMSQSESLHNFWWEFPPSSFHEPRLPFELPQVSPNGWGGVKATLGKCSKGSSFFLGMTSLSRPKVCYQRNGATPLNFLTSLYLILWNYSTVSIFCCCVCVWECQQKPGMNFYYIYIAEIVGHMELVDSKPLPKLHKRIC